MGFQAIAAGIAAAAAVAGTATSISSANSAAAAARRAQQEASQNQFQAFEQRMEAQRNELSNMTKINTAAAQRYTENQAAEQSAISGALEKRQQAINDENTQVAAASEQADQAMQAGLRQASPAAQQEAQAAQAASLASLNQPVLDALAPSNPTASPNGSSVVQDSTAAGDAAARKYVKNYQDTGTKLASYDVPLRTAGNAGAAITTGMLPAAAQEAIIKTAAPTLLEPSTLAYQQAKQWADIVNQANERETAGAAAIAQGDRQNRETLADLLQGDKAANIQSDLNQAQAKAAADASLGGGLLALGNLGISYSASRGGLTNLLPKSIV